MKSLRFLLANILFYLARFSSCAGELSQIRKIMCTKHGLSVGNLQAFSIRFGWLGVFTKMSTYTIDQSLGFLASVCATLI